MRQHGRGDYDRDMTPQPAGAITVQPVSPALADAVAALQVGPEQRDYVGDVAFNLADALRDPMSEAMAVLADATVIGFYRLDFAPAAVTGRRMEAPSVAVRAFLIDRAQQGRGYGVQAARALCADLQRRHPDRRLVILLVNNDNHAARATYRRAGFVDTGECFAGGRAGPQSLLIRALTVPGLAPAWDNARMDTAAIAPNRRRFLELAVRVQALRFGNFTLKSGRSSPYFFNAGHFDSGQALAGLAACYADALDAAARAGTLDEFDLLFGPAYKGIPLAAALACEYARRGRDLPLAFNRKQAKAHGEGGRLIGAPLAGRRVLIVDDVITAGTAIGEALAIIREGGGVPAGIVIALDREERIDADGNDRRSAAQAISAEHGIPVIAIAGLSDLLAFAGESATLAGERDRLLAYRARYGCTDRT